MGGPKKANLSPAEKALLKIPPPPLKRAAGLPIPKNMQTIEEVSVFAGGRKIGYVLEDEARDMLRSKEYALMPRKGRERRIRLIEETAERIAKAKALCNSSTRAALSTTQREELYQGLRRPGHGQTPTDGPVTKVITVVRKYRAGVGFINWGENEKFARKRFNPDKIPAPAFPSELAYRAFRAEQAARAAQAVQTSA